MKFRFIAEEKANFPVAFMCRQLSVSRAGFYAWASRGESKRAVEDRELVEFIRAEFDAHPRGCGSRPIVGALRSQQRYVSRKRVVRLMRRERLQPRLKRGYRVTRTCEETSAARNILDRRFAPRKTNRVWAADITCIRTRSGWAYLAVILDVGSRRVVGWNVSNRIDQDLTLGALKNALHTRRPRRGLIHHSDRGIQYAAHAYQAALRKAGARTSMSRKGNCWDNAVVESFFSSLKRELPNDVICDDWRHLQHTLFSYIEAHYNTKRRHSTLGYLSPNEYELRAA